LTFHTGRGQNCETTRPSETSKSNGKETLTWPLCGAELQIEVGRVTQPSSLLRDCLSPTWVAVA